MNGRQRNQVYVVVLGNRQIVKDIPDKLDIRHGSACSIIPHNLNLQTDEMDTHITAKNQEIKKWVFKER
jgi:hypothetical protein